MKKLLTIVAILLIGVVLSSCTISNENLKNEKLPNMANSNKWNKLIRKNQLKIGVYTLDNCFDNSLIDAFSQEIDIPIEKVLVEDKNELESKLSNGIIDMYWGLYPKESSQSLKFTLSSPYFADDSLTLTLSENTIIDENSVIGLLKNSSEELILPKEYKNILLYNDDTELINALNKNEVNAIMVNKTVFTSSQNYSSELYIYNTTPCSLVVVFKDGYDDVASEIDKVIAKVKASGKATEICEKWYGKDLILK